MRRIVRQIKKKRAIFVVFDEINSPVGEIVYHKSVSFDDFAIVFEHGAEIISPVAGAKTIKIIKSARIGVVGWLHAVVPFSIGCGNISGTPEKIGQGGFIQIQPFAIGRSGVDPTPRMVSSGQQLSTGWRTNRTHLKAVERDARHSQLVNVGGFKVGVSRNTQIAPSLVVSQDEDDVGIRRFIRFLAAAENRKDEG